MVVYVCILGMLFAESHATTMRTSKFMQSTAYPGLTVEMLARKNVNKK